MKKISLKNCAMVLYLYVIFTFTCTTIQLGINDDLKLYSTEFGSYKI